MPYETMFCGFEGRKKELAGVKRWHTIPTMFYRTTLADHEAMVYWMVQELLPFAIETFNAYFTPTKQRRALTLPWVHDDTEILTGDHPTPLKNGQLDLFRVSEEEAIEILAARWPYSVSGFSYRGLLEDAMTKGTLEAQLVSYADKIVGIGEALHELYAGNKIFLNDCLSGNPALRYIRGEFKRRKRKWPLIHYMLLSINHPLFNIPKEINFEEVVGNGSQHTEESVRVEKSYPIYNAYRRIMLERGGQRGLELLVEQREFEEDAGKFAESPDHPTLHLVREVRSTADGEQLGLKLAVIAA